MKPLVSVIMPVYNGEKYLRQAIDSVLTQTYKHIEFIIVNDGSKDKSDDIIRSYKDKRLRYIVHKKNIGLDNTLNQTFKKVKGKYIARMDCDDLSLSTRIAKQVSFMEKNHDYGLVGTQYINMSKSRTFYEVGAQLQDDFEIRYGIQSVNCFCHGAVMFRTSFIKKNCITYNHIYSPYEDYELWTRIIALTKVKNLDEVLYVYMNNPSGMFMTKHREMIDGPRKLGLKLQNELVLPEITWGFIHKIIFSAQKYKKNHVMLYGKNYESNFMLAYQTFLYKLGCIYLRRKKREGFILVLLSFYFSPINWFKKLLRIL